MYSALPDILSSAIQRIRLRALITAMIMSNSLTNASSLVSTSQRGTIHFHAKLANSMLSYTQHARNILYHDKYLSKTFSQSLGPDVSLLPNSNGLPLPLNKRDTKHTPKSYFECMRIDRSAPASQNKYKVELIETKSKNISSKTNRRKELPHIQKALQDDKCKKLSKNPNKLSTDIDKGYDVENISSHKKSTLTINISLPQAGTETPSPPPTEPDGIHIPNENANQPKGLLQDQGEIKGNKLETQHHPDAKHHRQYSTDVVDNFPEAVLRVSDCIECYSWLKVRTHAKSCDGLLEGESVENKDAEKLRTIKCEKNKTKKVTESSNDHLPIIANLSEPAKENNTTNSEHQSKLTHITQLSKLTKVPLIDMNTGPMLSNRKTRPDGTVLNQTEENIPLRTTETSVCVRQNERRYQTSQFQWNLEINNESRKWEESNNNHSPLSTKIMNYSMNTEDVLNNLMKRRTGRENLHTVKVHNILNINGGRRGEAKKTTTKIQLPIKSSLKQSTSKKSERKTVRFTKNNVYRKMIGYTPSVQVHT
ncbi:uncharacterized protein LOC117119807 [Anneissia japonica]|uniref:uncharacterized protein LOC117119807 n=1 Tax=Anneissia japonica TaxID=1529436 RepID=UPI001425B6E5|nr:uncharacterized protein LOC117119807 [Anneissia japonica]